MSDHYYAVIMAGGGGTRLWPVSRRNTPKQIIRLFGEKSLFQMAVDRLQGFIPPENIYIVTIADQVEQLRSQQPEINNRNFLIEPKPRGTAAVVAMAAAAIRKRDPQATLAILTADHFITNVPEFQKTLTAAYELANNGFITTMGVKPVYPATGYGYIESGEELGLYSGIRGYRVLCFVEKPDEVRAGQFFRQDNMTWNSGMFICRADVILGEFKKHMPELYSTLDSLLPSIGEDHSGDAFVQAWTEIQPQTIDYGVMEKTTLAAVLPVKDLGWNDVGSWDSFFEVSDSDENGNIVVQARYVGVGTKDSLIVSTDAEKLVVTLGMKNVIIVQTPDAVLICPRGESQRVKELVDYLKEHHYTLFL